MLCDFAQRMRSVITHAHNSPCGTKMHVGQYDATRCNPEVQLYPGVPRDLQRHLVTLEAISVAAGSDIERCYTNSP